MYGKIFESMYDGTLAADWKVMVTFQQMIVLADEDGVVDMTPPAISRRTGIPLEIIEHGIKKLEQPDPYSRTQDNEGRRIENLDDHRPWGWKIVNYGQYRDMASRQDKKSAARERKRRQRARERERPSQDTDSNGESHGVTQSHTVSRMSRHTDTDTDTNSLSRAGAREDFSGRKAPEDFEPPDEMIEKMIAETGLTREQIDQATAKFRDHCYERTTFDWHGRWRNWIRTERQVLGRGQKVGGSSDPYFEQIQRATQ